MRLCGEAEEREKPIAEARDTVRVCAGHSLDNLPPTAIVALSHQLFDQQLGQFMEHDQAAMEMQTPPRSRNDPSVSVLNVSIRPERVELVDCEEAIRVAQARGAKAASAIGATPRA